MFIDNLKDELNYSITENGALGYKTTNKDIVDFNFKISSYRNKTPEQIRIDFKKVWYEDKELALKLLFYIISISHFLIIATKSLVILFHHLNNNSNWIKPPVCAIV